MPPKRSVKRKRNGYKRPRGSPKKVVLDVQYLQASSLLCRLPNELLLTIFSNLLEQDLCRVSQVCRRFYDLANDKKLWETLYKDVFEYDLVLLIGKKNDYEFLSPDDLTCANPWKMSMSGIYHGLHVRDGYQCRTAAGRNVKHFDTIESALNHSKDMTRRSAVLVFVHTGTHRVSRVEIDCEVALIGAAPGTVVESVVVDCVWTFPCAIHSSSRHTYIGHVTLRFAPFFNLLRHIWFILGVFSGGTVKLDHCLIRHTRDVTGPLTTHFAVENGVEAFEMKHCVVLHPYAAAVRISSPTEVVHVATVFISPQSLPPSCPWVRLGLDMTRHEGCKCVGVCSSPRDTQTRRWCPSYLL